MADKIILTFELSLTREAAATYEKYVSTTQNQEKFVDWIALHFERKAVELFDIRLDLPTVVGKTCIEVMPVE